MFDLGEVLGVESYTLDSRLRVLVLRLRFLLPVLELLFFVLFDFVMVLLLGLFSSMLFDLLVLFATNIVLLVYLVIVITMVFAW